MKATLPPMESPAERRRRRRRVPDAIRKRAPRACDRCKARKNKCIETPSGVCVRCTEGSHPCRFERERSPAGEEHEASTSTITSITAGTRSIGIPERESNRTNNDVSFTLNTPLGQSMNDEFSPADSAPSEAFMWPRFLSRLRDAFCLDSQPPSGDQDLASLQPRISDTPPADPAERRRIKRAVKSFPPRGVADFLVSVCIAYGTDIFFYLDQSHFMAELDQLYNDEQSTLREDAGFVCLVLAVFALGSQWTALARPEDLSSAASTEDRSVDPGRIFYNQARILISDLLDRPCIKSVQATFILGVYLMPASAISASYVYMGLALRKALAIGLHQEPDDPSLTEDEKETRRRLWWSIYSLERTVTIKLNRPRSVDQEIITAGLPKPTSRDASQKFDNLQHQIANAAFVRIIDKLSEPGSVDLSSPKQCPKANVTSRGWSNTNHSHTGALRRPTDAQISLKAWKKGLPSSLKLQNVDPKSSSYRAVFHLHLNYYFAWIDMGKVSVVTVVRGRLQTIFHASAGQSDVPRDVEQSSEACIKAAKKMLELFEGLCRGGNMARFSFTDFQGCSIATIIVLLAGILDRDSGYEGRVAFGLDCLRKMSSFGNTTAKMGVRFVEALQSITNEARSKLVMARRREMSQAQEASSGQAEGYGRWAEWLATAEVVGSPSSDESDLEGEQSGQPPAPAHGPLISPDIMLSSPWEEAAALQLQEMSASNFGMPAPEGVAAEETTLMPLPTGEEAWLPSFAWNDDQMYLMGLTGMDGLDFMGGIS
ncbi:Zn(2)-Cys(6) binuclear cluster domain containing transcription factor [Colletotrichum costaricense]|uniref:Thiamine repressible genes regulatory protein thi1 n=1 Tax=Colletotrichum costaricense TaxID=1209916 RepID=A0AAI9YI67_9PEZI|nr:Zn(2)-Cys(6) binuclear cluster domain containing transcription factor [Colletotrichum costaricense]KAK1511218.1 thiamine repressible genes regulatory protein thi1 [Colletotrichum costaricense]